MVVECEWEGNSLFGNKSFRSRDVEAAASVILETHVRIGVSRSEVVMDLFD